jgi:hypothetical protein
MKSMGYIIVWRNSQREPHIDIDSRGFKEYYYSYEEAQKAAEYVVKQEGPQSQWYFDYAIYEEVTE